VGSPAGDQAGSDAAAAGPGIRQHLGSANGNGPAGPGGLARYAGGPQPTAEQLAPLHALARHGCPQLSVDAAGQILLASQPRGSLAAGLLGVLLVVRDAQQQGSWPRLRTCRNPDCRWAFFDRSHARRGTWCDMAACGNMIKNRNFRARQQVAAHETR